MMADHYRQSEILADYVLDVLPEAARAEVESHLAVCARCRETVTRERELVAEVRQTLVESGQTDAGRRKRMMPSPPTVDHAIWRPAVALVLLLVFFLGVVQSELPVWEPDGQGILSNPTTTALVATATTTPTATHSPRSGPSANIHGESARPQAPAMISPAPGGTRLVALPAGRRKQ